MALYTGKGDGGTTKLFGPGERIAKDAPRVEALGAIDEANSWIGYCRALVQHDEPIISEMLLSFQEDLFIIQAQCAGAPKEISRERIDYLERIIADAEAELDPIHSFTIPGATTLSAALDVGRTIVRRAERTLIAVPDLDRSLHIIPYMNRLSSALFALARVAARRAGARERAPQY